MNIFRSLGRVASQAAKAIKPKRLSGPKYGIQNGLKHLTKKHGLKAVLLTSGVALGSGADALVDLAKGQPGEQPPVILIGGKLSDQIMKNNPWNISRFDRGNQDSSKEKGTTSMQTTDPPTMAAHSDTLDHGLTHVIHHRDQQVEFLSKIKAAFLLLTIVAIVYCLIKLGRTMGKWLRRWCRRRRDSIDLRDLP